MTLGSYQEFIKHKRIVDIPTGFNPTKLHSFLFDFQADITRWAIRRGRAALLEDCGLGKTPQQLEWANQVFEETGSNVLILAPMDLPSSKQHHGVIGLR